MCQTYTYWKTLRLVFDNFLGSLYSVKSCLANFNSQLLFLFFRRKILIATFTQLWVGGYIPYNYKQISLRAVRGTARRLIRLIYLPQINIYTKIHPEGIKRPALSTHLHKLKLVDSCVYFFTPYLAFIDLYCKFSNLYFNRNCHLCTDIVHDIKI